MQTVPTTKVVGRFAPSPTGPLHFGSLVAAVGSYLLARQAGGRWLLRMEDLDLPRVVPGAADAMLRLLERLGFIWDGEVVYQSQRFERYQQVLDCLRSRTLLFDCSCSRRDILASAPHPGEEGPIYPGTCRNGMVGSRVQSAVRIKVPGSSVCFTDGVYGPQKQHLVTAVGDFVLRRSDGLFAYQLAVVVDDIDSSVNQVVRGSDLLSSTPRQVYLYSCLGESPPHYYHLPLALSADGDKISKRHGPSSVINDGNGSVEIWRALDFLGQQPPRELQSAGGKELLAWGMEHFQSDLIPTCNQIVAAESVV
ncbi:MAG TPA: tRNA glutamyl-Q(34) synthetase GluQRS [Geopsychrobacteraceae bacterium]|nr:tRNA glutamyl-Q(34) synthetase GluQRS [Geopsychrobacteraceae bacterium]